MLDGEIQRQIHRLEGTPGREPCQMQVRETPRIDPALKPGDALIVDIDVTQDMRRLAAGWIDALALAHEANMRNAETMNFVLLPRRNFALDAHEAFLRREFLA